MNPGDFLGNQCRTKAAFEFIPKKNAKLNLKAAAQKLRERGIKISAETPFLLVIDFEGDAIELFENWQVAVRGTLEESKARAVLGRLLEKLG